MNGVSSTTVHLLLLYQPSAHFSVLDTGLFPKLSLLLKQLCGIITQKAQDPEGVNVAFHWY